MVKLFGGNKDIALLWWKFPAGERSVKIVDPLEIHRYKNFTIIVDFQSSDDLIDMMLLTNACRNVLGSVSLRLAIPYFPFARQDRVMSAGEALAVQIPATMIKSCNFNDIEIWDPHSSVVEALFEPGKLTVRSQAELLYPIIKVSLIAEETALISPDAGASKKVYALAKLLNTPVIEASKSRDVSTGAISKTNIDLEAVSAYNRLIVVDDICDGGKTFIELAKVLRTTFKGQLDLVVTHGIFSKGLDELNKYYNYIYSANDMRNKNNV